MTSKTVIENKVSTIRKYLNILRRYEKYTCEEIKNNIDIRGALERYLYLAAQATIDLAEAVISYRGLRKPATMSEAFYILNENDIISDILTEKMAAMTGCRNILAHDYEEIDYDIIYEILQKGLRDIEEFIGEVVSL